MYGRESDVVVGGGELEMSEHLFDQFSVSSVPHRVGVVPGSGDLVVDHFRDLVLFGLPQTFQCR